VVELAARIAALEAPTASESDSEQHFVNHRKFGRGRVLADDGDVVTVEFEDNTIRRLKRSFLMSARGEEGGRPR
jgi:hypothetical protein